jgi:hypothetical protein
MDSKGTGYCLELMYYSPGQQACFGHQWDANRDDMYDLVPWKCTGVIYNVHRQLANCFGRGTEPYILLDE